MRGEADLVKEIDHGPGRVRVDRSVLRTLSLVSLTRRCRLDTEHLKISLFFKEFLGAFLLIIFNLSYKF